MLFLCFYSVFSSNIALPPDICRNQLIYPYCSPRPGSVWSAGETYPVSWNAEFNRFATDLIVDIRLYRSNDRKVVWEQTKVSNFIGGIQLKVPEQSWFVDGQIGREDFFFRVTSRTSLNTVDGPAFEIEPKLLTNPTTGTDPNVVVVDDSHMLSSCAIGLIILAVALPLFVGLGILLACRAYRIRSTHVEKQRIVDPFFPTSTGLTSSSDEIYDNIKNSTIPPQVDVDISIEPSFDGLEDTFRSSALVEAPIYPTTVNADEFMAVLVDSASIASGNTAAGVVNARKEVDVVPAFAFPQQADVGSTVPSTRHSLSESMSNSIPASVNERSKSISLAEFSQSIQSFGALSPIEEWFGDSAPFPEEERFDDSSSTEEALLKGLETSENELTKDGDKNESDIFSKEHESVSKTDL